MADWPANGDTDWNTKMLAYLAIEHNTDGTHDVHNSEGGYMQVDVNGTKANVYTKYFSGNLDSDSSTSVAHSITSGLTKILSVTASVYNDSFSKATVGSYQDEAITAHSWRLEFTDANIDFVAVGSNAQGNRYTIKIDYIL